MVKPMSVTQPSVIRSLRAGDDLSALTSLIHAAYAPQALKGLRYWGTHQSVAVTEKRFAAGHGLVAELEERYVGTITVRPPQPESPVAIYRDPHTWTIGQYAVDPTFKGRGLGRALHDAALRYAILQGARSMALDTAAPAEPLISMYRAWGYEVVGEVDWRPHTNFLSIVMCKALAERESKPFAP